MFLSRLPDMTRVWARFSQHLIAKIWTIDRKLRFSFSYPVVSLRISFIRQKNRSTRFRCAWISGSCGIWIPAFDLDGITASAPSSAMACLMAFDPYALSATMAADCFFHPMNAPNALLSWVCAPVISIRKGRPRWSAAA